MHGPPHSQPFGASGVLVLSLPLSLFAGCAVATSFHPGLCLSSMAVMLHAVGEAVIAGKRRSVLLSCAVLTAELQALKTLPPFRFCRRRPLVVVWVSLP